MKFFLGVFFLVTILSASDDLYEIRSIIFAKVFSQIDINKELILWSPNKKLLSSMQNIAKLKTSDNCEDATVLILDDNYDLSSSCSKKTIFVTEYELLNKIPRSFGALFFNKGRSNIVIIKPRVSEQNIQIKNGLKKYLEEKVW